jgi:hypothetical protein
MINLKDKRVLVLGLGVHGGGRGVAWWLVKCAQELFKH